MGLKVSLPRGAEIHVNWGVPSTGRSPSTVQMPGACLHWYVHQPSGAYVLPAGKACVFGSLYWLLPAD